MAARRVATITLVEKLKEGTSDTEAETLEQIRQAIDSSTLSKSWKIDHIALLDTDSQVILRPYRTKDGLVL